jgi:hypothetical protein
MKSITNDSLQAFQIFLNYPTGVRSIFIAPKQTLVVPGSSISKQVTVMASRRILKVREA